VRGVTIKTSSHRSRSARVIGLLAGVVLLSGVWATPGGASSSGASATPGNGKVTYRARAVLTGPITTGHVIEPLSANPTGLAAHGYVEQEFFAAGTAAAFQATSSPSNGRWVVKPTSTASYRTRILVRRPSDPAHFNGTVVVEWMNVSAGESAPDWDYLNPELMRQGYAYVAVSAQAQGVQGGTPILGSPVAGGATGLVGTEPARYGTLHHPGDQYALDMFAQIGEALRSPRHAVLGGQHPKRVIAVGESQSAYYLTTFADALQPLTHAFDGIFIHSRGGSGAPLNGSGLASKQGVPNLWIRTDLDIPVFMFETQTDLISLGYAPAQQPNTNRIRTWEVAGTSHADAYEVGPAVGLLGCTTPVNDGPQHQVVQAAFVAFNRWLDDGTPPPSPARFRLASTSPPTLLLQPDGNVVGGVRTPDVDVPVSTLSGAPPAGANALCSLFGSTTPFSEDTLISLYTNPAGYLKAYRASLAKAIKLGYLLPSERAGLIAKAQQVQFP
jgi:hypothetical protein